MQIDKQIHTGYTTIKYSTSTFAYHLFRFLVLYFSLVPIMLVSPFSSVLLSFLLFSTSASLLLLSLSCLFPCSVSLPLINLNLYLCSLKWDVNTEQTGTVMCHFVSATCSHHWRHRRACKENQITFVCPFIFSSNWCDCVCVCTQGFVFTTCVVCKHVPMKQLH